MAHRRRGSRTGTAERGTYHLSLLQVGVRRRLLRLHPCPVSGGSQIMSATQDATYATPGLVLVMEPPWMCILHNCECHTLEEVVGQLVKALECSTEEALTLAITAHEIGKSMVAVGPH